MSDPEAKVLFSFDQAGHNEAISVRIALRQDRMTCLVRNRILFNSITFPTGKSQPSPAPWKSFADVLSQGNPEILHLHAHTAPGERLSEDTARVLSRERGEAVANELVKAGGLRSKIRVHAHGTRFSASLGAGSSEGLGRVELGSSEVPRDTSILRARRVEPTFAEKIAAEVEKLPENALVEGGIHARHACFERPRARCASFSDSDPLNEWALAFVELARSGCGPD